MLADILANQCGMVRLSHGPFSGMLTTPLSSQQRCCAVVAIAAQYRIPFSASFLEVLAAGEVECTISLETTSSPLEVQGLRNGGGCSARAAMDTRINVAHAVWSGNHGWFRCHSVSCPRDWPSSTLRLQVPSFCAARGRTLSTAVWKKCQTLGGIWLRSMIPYAQPRGKPWHPGRPGFRPSPRIPVALVQGHPCLG